MPDTANPELAGHHRLRAAESRGQRPGHLADRVWFAAGDVVGAQVSDPQSLLALRVNGADLPRDHGYPARTIVSNAPGVHNTKWVNKITFLENA